MQKFKILATTSFGLESVVKSELMDLGYMDLTVENGKITFEGTAFDICRVNINLRCAERIYIKLKEFKATDFDQLFDNINEIPWDEYLPKDGKYIVNAKSVKSELYSLSAIQSISKKSIIEKLKESYKIDTFKEDGDKYPILISITKDITEILIDTSGDGLHKRGYRTKTSRAPLRETLAAALVKLSYWKPDRTFIDPFCGSGTIVIEAALIGKNIAPGLLRRFAGDNFKFIKKDMWKKARKEALLNANYDQELKIIGTDIDPDILKIARENAERANVADDIHFQEHDVADISSADKYGYIVCNPPYGERMNNKSEVANLYRKTKKAFDSLDTWSYGIITSFSNFENTFGKKANKKRKLYNGTIKTYFYKYYGPKPPKKRFN